MQTFAMMLRPSRIIRSKAMYSGVLGHSKFWKAVAVWVFGKSMLQRFFGRRRETLINRSLGPGARFNVQTEKPLTRRQIKRMRRAGTWVPRVEQLAAEQAWADEIVARKLAGKKRRRFPLPRR